MKINNINEIEKLLPSDFINRNLLNTIKKDISKKEVQIIYGPRQVGKSSIIYSLMKDLYSDNIDMFYYNLDLPDDVFESAETFISDIQSKKKGDKTITYIFIDEIQRKSDIGLFLKYIYDRGLGFKFIVTGSSSLNIKNIVNEPLTGRKFEYMLHPLGINEILNWKGIDVTKLEISTPDVSQIIEEYMLYGGYPDVVQLVSHTDKSQKLDEITKSYITRDLVETFKIGKSNDLNKCAIYLSQNTSNLLSKENLSNVLSISVHSVNKYIEALEKSFVISLLYPFYSNPAKEISHRPKVYFLDNGIRNSLINKMSDNLIVSDKGALFEQTVFQILDEQGKSIKYWRNLNQTEVDFIIRGENGLKAIETKYTWKFGRKTKSLASFKTSYNREKVETSVVSKENLVKLFSI